MVRKYKKNKFYHVVWDDHSNGDNEWTEEAEIEFEDTPCETVGIFVKETEKSIFLCLSKYTDENTYFSTMMILKSTIVKSKELK